MASFCRYVYPKKHKKLFCFETGLVTKRLLLLDYLERQPINTLLQSSCWKKSLSDTNFFFLGNIQNIQKKMLLDICQTANPRALLLFLGNDWLKPQGRLYLMLTSTLLPTRFPLCVSMQIKVFLEFELLKQGVPGVFRWGGLKYLQISAIDRKMWFLTSLNTVRFTDDTFSIYC